MRSFTVARDDGTPDELWLCEHPPVYTQGVAGDDRHVLEPGDIPVARSDRGGQVTYHGPGQVVAYPLVDLGRLRLHVREYVFRLEQAALDVLERLGVTGHRVRGAPGIYVRLADPGGHAPLGAEVTLTLVVGVCVTFQTVVPVGDRSTTTPGALIDPGASAAAPPPGTGVVETPSR